MVETIAKITPGLVVEGGCLGMVGESEAKIGRNDWR